MKSGQAKAIANGKCCFCGLDVAIAEDVVTKKQMVLHELPMCDEYEKTDADEFTKRVNFRPIETGN